VSFLKFETKLLVPQKIGGILTRQKHKTSVTFINSYIPNGK